MWWKALKRLQLLDWVLDIDAEKTKAYYDGVSIEDCCSCVYCKNYRKACETFPLEIIDFYKIFGIDPKKEGEFMEFETEDNKHLYFGFYHFVGTIIQGTNNVTQNWNNLNLVKIDCFKFGFNDRLDLVPKDFPKPIVQLEFEVMLPWILNE